jgi:hypothetical protein
MDEKSLKVCRSRTTVISTLALSKKLRNIKLVFRWPYFWHIFENSDGSKEYKTILNQASNVSSLTLSKIKLTKKILSRKISLTLGISFGRYIDI